MASPPSDKPLPPPPTSTSGKELTRLCIEGRAHLRQFIKHALAEEHVDGAYEWAKGIELALKEMCDSMSRGRWLAGLKAARVAASARRREKDRLEKEERARQRDAALKEGDGKGKAPKPEEVKADDEQTPKPTERTPEERKRAALEQVQKALKTPSIPSPKPKPAHLLLTLSPKNAILPPHDLDFDIIPSNKICIFSTDKFVLPSSEHWHNGNGGIILYGLDEWDATEAQETIRIVGGTFSFSGIGSAAQFQSLSKVLRLSIFVCLSLILEQHLLSDSSVHLHFPAEVASQPLGFSYSSPEMPARQPRRSAKPSGTGIWSFFAKRAENLLNRAANVPISSVQYARTQSLDTSSQTPVRARSSEALSPSPSPRHSRRLSFSLIPGPSRNAGEDDKANSDSTPLISTALTRITASSSILSSSFGVVFPLPPILSELAEKEKDDPNRRLLGYEKVSLCSLLGWEGRESRGRGMAGLPGFVRHQGITFLYAEYAPRSQAAGSSQPSASTSASSVSQSSGAASEKEGEGSVRQEGSSSSASSSSAGQSSAGTTSSSSSRNASLVPCERGRWVTYRYFKRDRDGRSRKYGDRSLGDALESFCLEAGADTKCEKQDCEVRRIYHRRFWIHGGVRISAEIAERKDKQDGEEDGSMSVWETCDVCRKATTRRKLLEGSYLFSFAKFLELLIYSPALCTLSPRLCDHTTPPPLPWPPNDSPPRSRFNIIRHFICSGSKLEVQFSMAQAPALFELRVPRLQIMRGRNGTSQTSEPARKGSIDGASFDSNEEKRVLRREIKQWWQSIADHMDMLDLRFSDSIISRKSLPRLPSSDDWDADEVTESTPKAEKSTLPLVQESPARTPSPESCSKADTETDTDLTPTPSRFTNDTDESVKPSNDPSHLLTNLRENFQRTEQSLYAQLSKTPTSNLNEVRRSFATVSKGARLRLSAWEKKHAPKEVKKGELGKFETVEPEWWKPGCHAVPGGNVIVREGEWASMIAFTLSSLDYQRELANMTAKSNPNTSEKSSATSSQASSSLSPFGESNASSVSIPTVPPSPKPPSAKVPLDPDSDICVWYEPESHTAVINRQDHPRDPTGVLSLRDVLRQRRSIDQNGSVFSAASVFGGAKFSPSKFVSAISGAPVTPRERAVSNGTPPSAWAQPAVQVSMHAADGVVSGLPDTSETAEKLLQDMDATTETTSTSLFFPPWRSVPNSPDPTRKRRPPSLISVESDCTETNSIIGPVVDTSAGLPSRPTTANSSQTTTPTDSTGQSYNPSSTSLKPPERRNSTASKATTESGPHKPDHRQSATVTSFTTSLASTVTNAVKYFLNPEEDGARPQSPMQHHHKLLALDNQSMEDRPHVKYDWTVGKRMKFSCTVYYAKQFEFLRRKCGVEDILPKSLARSSNWAAEGGKSRSNFWKTSDDRFVIKTLVNAWNVADLQVLLELAPAYFRYMESTAHRPSVLAKLLGFYTIEIKNLESGAVQAKADLLVMENLFFERQVTKTFDLKGIQGRKVKATGSSSEKKTLFDGEWIEGQQKALILVYPHSKLVLHEAIKADADFLSKNNIMDYSLLLGVDEERRQIACGLVDTIGSYTFAKTLEYKAKQNLNSGKEVTVIPPNEYHDRFVSAMNNYFLACPDKWSKPIYDPSSDKIDSDLTLPSVL